MVDFTSLLKKRAGEAKKPPAYPAADYPGIIKGFELGDANKNKPLQFGALFSPVSADGVVE